MNGRRRFLSNHSQTLLLWSRSVNHFWFLPCIECSQEEHADGLKRIVKPVALWCDWGWKGLTSVSKRNGAVMRVRCCKPLDSGSRSLPGPAGAGFSFPCVSQAGHWASSCSTPLMPWPAHPCWSRSQFQRPWLPFQEGCLPSPHPGRESKKMLLHRCDSLPARLPEARVARTCPPPQPDPSGGQTPPASLAQVHLGVTF